MGTLDGLDLLTSESNVTYYRGRWREAKKHSGACVARRSRRYGADAWCFVKLDLGRPVGLVDLPTPDYRYRPCDEAWHLQQAIDFVSGNPQRYRLRSIADRKLIAFDFFSPVPRWAHRRWNALGEQLEQRGTLFSYLFNQEYLTQEAAFAEWRDMVKTNMIEPIDANAEIRSPSTKPLPNCNMHCAIVFELLPMSAISKWSRKGRLSSMKRG